MATNENYSLQASVGTTRWRVNVSTTVGKRWKNFLWKNQTAVSSLFLYGKVHLVLAEDSSELRCHEVKVL